MEKLFKQAKIYWNRLAARERIIVIVAMIAVSLMLWSELLYKPGSNKAGQIEKQINATNSKIQHVQSETRTLQAALKKDPDAENRRLLAEHIEEGKQLDTMLEKTSIQIISARDMTVLLKNMLAQHPGLEFISLENRPATPDFIDEASNQGGYEGAITVFRHGVTLKLEGGYHDVLLYLKTLENMPWRFFWEGIEIETIEYPITSITLDVYTLGFRRSLLGV